MRCSEQAPPPHVWARRYYLNGSDAYRLKLLLRADEEVQQQQLAEEQEEEGEEAKQQQDEAALAAAGHLQHLGLHEHDLQVS